MKNMGKTNLSAEIVKVIADKMAKISYGTASIWGMHQPKEPNKKK